MKHAPFKRESVRKLLRPRLRVLKHEPLPGRRHGERRVRVHADPLPLEIRGRGKIVAYACGSCGSVHPFDDRHGSSTWHTAEAAAGRAAACCRRARACISCGTDILTKYERICPECRSVAERRQLIKKLRAAIVIDGGDVDGPVCCEFSRGFWGEGYSPDVESHLEAWEEDHDDDDRSPFVWATTPVHVSIDEDWLAESVTEKLHEDAEFGDLPGADKVYEAIDAFNRLNRDISRSFVVDYSHVIVLDRTGFDELLALDPHGDPDIRWKPRPNNGGATWSRTWFPNAGLVGA